MSSRRATPASCAASSASRDTIYPVKALLGVIADADVSDAEIDAFVASYVTPAAEEGEAEDAGAAV